MAEIPGTPSAPDPADDDLSPAAFDGLGLGSLSDDVRPSRSQWADVEAAADRRGTGRRPWLISAAAVVVLIVAVAGLVVARSGTEGPDVVAGGGVGGGPDGTYLLPPDGSSVIGVYADPDRWYIQYAEPDGHAWFLSSLTISGLDPGYVGLYPLGFAGQVSPFGLTLFQCSPGYGPGVPPVEPVRASWGAGYPGASLIPTSTTPWWAQQPPTVEQPCVEPTAPVASLTDQMSKLRRVSFAEWAKFLADNGEVRTTNPTGPPTPTTEVSTTTTTVTSTTTTAVDATPADPGSAEDQIRAAVEQLAGPYDVETFPYLEDGTTRAAEYRQMFATAGRQSGAQAVGGQPATDFSLLTVRLTAPDRATILIGMHTRLPSGEFDFTQDGGALLQDGRWVISYDTIARMVGRACLPPGGYDGCPAS